MTTTFSASRTLPGTTQRVWELLTEPESFSIWFGTEQVAVPLDRLEMDVRPGGKMQAVMVLPDGHEIHWHGQYTEVRAHDFLAMGLSNQPGGDLGVQIKFCLTLVEGATDLTIVQDRGDFSDEQVARTISGYGSFLETMERMLEA